MQLPIICYYTSVNPMIEILYIIANESAFLIISRIQRASCQNKKLFYCVY